MHIILLTILIIFVIYWYRFCPNFLHPANVFALVWIIIIFLWCMDSFFTIIGYTETTSITLLPLFLSLIAFLIGSYSASLKNLTKVTPYANNFAGYSSNRFLIASGILFVLCTIGYISYFSDLSNKIYLMSPSEDTLQQWNYEATESRRTFGGLLGRLYVLPSLAIPLNIFALQYQLSRKKRFFLIAVSLCEAVFLFSPRRSLMIQTLIACLLLLMLFKANSKKILVTACSILFSLFVFFSYTQSLLNKGIGEGIVGGLKDIYLYLTGNIPSFEILSQQSLNSSFYLTLNVIHRALFALGIATVQPDLSIQFVKIPIEYNTIPYFYYFIRDFGLTGSTIISLFLGYFITRIYYSVLKKATYFKTYVLLILLTFIVFSFRENTLITYDTFYFVAIAFLIEFIILRKIILC